MTGQGIRCYVDIAGDDHTGTPGRWEYAPEPLAALRESARIAHPESLPGEIRDEYREKHRAALRETRQRLREIERDQLAAAARAESEAAKRAGWLLEV
ncbi:hypothetical protein A4X16_16645 [Microbacterium sp. H83]|nr:hypothetical protein A4X16_16645 [Microbacterium sp. H83]